MSNKNYIPPTPIHPGQYIKDEIEFLEISVSELSKKTGISVFILNSIIKKKKNITPDIAVKIENAIDFPAEALIKLQLKFFKDKQIIEIQNQLDNISISNKKKNKILSSILNV